MYPVSANFHTLAIQDAPKTRVRVYFIGDAVDCTDDNAVQTNGTLLIGKAGDTDSNGRIGQNGITFSEFFNPDKNIQVGAAVSSQIGMTLLNTDGALDNFQYGRCKVYLDVYDAANSSWLTCPMGVYIIDLPTKRKVQLINATGYDQMQKLDEICDTWWSALNWSGGINLSQLLTSLATQIGVSVSSNTASAIVNGSVSFTEEPFQCIEVTYREVLEYIAEATGTIARFDRNGALDLRWFAAAQISGNTVTVNTDTVGNQCLAISVAEYSVAAVDLLKVKLYTDDIGTTVGTGTNQYTIVNNLFLDGADSSAIIAKATPIYNRLNGLGAYSPVSARIITDWSIEAGDIINIVHDSTTYSVPIFQQSMAWRGGYVVSDLLSDGDNVRPVLDYDERTYYRLNSEMSKKVGGNEIISKINQSPEQITIQANKLSLLGYTTINDGFKVNLDGTFEAKGATIEGIINVGGNNNTSGEICIYDPTGTLTGKIDNQGVQVWNYDSVFAEYEYTILSSGYITLKTGNTLNALIGRSSHGEGSIEVYDENGVSRVSMFAETSSPRLGVYASSGNQHSLVTEADFRTVYPNLNVATDLGNDSTHSYLKLKDPDGTTSIELDSLNGSYFNTKINANSGLSVTGDLTVDGVLDVTPRRCEATLSSAGWYRVLKYATNDANRPKGNPSFAIDITITKSSTGSGSETHKITLLARWDTTSNGLSFVDESSSSYSMVVDKIRYNLNGGNGYVDIHFTANAENVIYVDFNVHCDPALQSAFTAESLQSVAASPSGETVLTEYTFAANTEAVGTVVGASGFTPSEIDVKRSGRVVYVHFFVRNVSIAANTHTLIGTISGVPLPEKNIRWLAGGGAQAYDAVTPVYAILGTDGSIKVTSPSAISAVNITISYIV